MDLSQSALSAIALSAIAIALVALAVALSLGRRLRTVRRSWSLRHRGAAPSGADPAERGSFDRELGSVRDGLARAIQRVGLVRFDAFDDMGGRLSFAAALLDEEGSGIVFSSINGRNETRIYAKAIEHGQSRIQLSDEEVEAIRRALGVRV